MGDFADLSGKVALVTGAGTYIGGKLEDNTLEAVRRVHQVNVESIFLIDTDMGRLVFKDFVDIGVAADLAEAEEAILQTIPMATLGTVEDIARMTAG